MRELYAEVYAQPPYREGPEDVAGFAADWPRRVGQPGVRLVLGHTDAEPTRFASGHQLVRGTRRGRGLGRTVYGALLHGRGEERATLLVRPEAEQARRLYQDLGYRAAGRIRPGEDAPVYDALLLEFIPPR